MSVDLKYSKQPEKAPVMGVGSGNRIILILIGLLTVVAYWGVHRNALTNKTTAAAMNIVGKQRMLIQRVYMLCDEITLRKDDKTLKLLRENLFATARQMEKSHGWIINGNMELGLSGAPPPSVGAMLYEGPLLLDGRMRRFASAAKEFSAKPENELTRENPLFKFIEKEEGLEANLIRDWDAVASQYQKESAAEAEKTELAEISLLGGILALLLASSLFVFRSMARRLRTNALRQMKSERLFRSMTESANDAIISADKNGAIVSWNGGAQRLFGYSEAEVLGGPLALIIPARYREAHANGSARTTLPHDFHMIGKTAELRGLRKDGSEFPVEISVASWNTDEGVYFSAIIRDVTWRKAAEEERIRFFNLPLDMMCIAGTDGYFKKVNQAFIKTLGYSERELLERPFVELIHPDDRQPTIREVEKLLKGGVTQDFENRYRCKDGAYLWFSWKAVAVLDEGLLYATVRDVTERKRIEESNKLKTEYLELLLEITSNCNEARTTNDVLRVFIDRICAYIGWPVGHVFVPDATSKMVSSGVWHFDDEVRSQPFRKITDEAVFEPGMGQVGRVWQSKEPEWIADVTIDAGFIRPPRAPGERVDLSVKAAFALPVLEKGNVTAVLEFFSAAVVPPVESFLNLGTHLGSELGLIFSQKKAEEKLKDSEKKYKSLTESANDAIISADKAGNIVFWNKGATRLFGYEESEVMGLSLTILMPERYREGHSIGIARANATGQFSLLGKTMELCGLKKDGGEFPLEISVAGWNAGERMFFSAIIRDISNRREAELELNILRSAVEQAAEMIVITDYNGAIEYVNPAFERVTGYGAGEAIGSNPRLLNSGRQTREFYEEMWGNIHAGRIWFGQVINRKKSGEEYPEEITISPVKGEDGKITHFMAIARDISENMSMRSQLIQAEKLSSIGTLVSGVAHEINNPLTAILGFSEMLLSKGGDLPADVARGIGVIHQQAERTSKIVRDLLRFSRKQDVERTSLEISDVLEGVFSLQAHGLRSENIEILRDYGAGHMRVFGNMSQLQQVFMNIIQNGAYELKKAHGGGVIAVRTEMRDGEALVFFENDGPPIPPDVMSRLFDPFFTTKGVGEGTGLGLSISYGIVKDHGGRVWAENIGESGVRFVVALPLDGSEISPNQTVKKPAGREFSGLCVLVVEDEREVREWLLTLLRTNGAVVHSSENGKEAIEQARANDYDLIISDLKMPEMDGFKVGEWLREHRPEQFRRFMLITGSIDSEVVEFSRNFGCRVLQKPFSQNELFASIREMSDPPAMRKA